MLSASIRGDFEKFIDVLIASDVDVIRCIDEDAEVEDLTKALKMN